MIRLDSIVVLNFIYHVFYHVKSLFSNEHLCGCSTAEKRVVCLRAHGAVSLSKDHTLNYTSVKHFGSHSLLDL